MKAMLDLIITRSTPLFEFTDVKDSRKAEANSDRYLVTAVLRLKPPVAQRKIFRPNIKTKLWQMERASVNT